MTIASIVLVLVGTLFYAALLFVTRTQVNVDVSYSLDTYLSDIQLVLAELLLPLHCVVWSLTIIHVKLEALYAGGKPGGYFEIPRAERRRALSASPSMDLVDAAQSSSRPASGRWTDLLGREERDRAGGRRANAPRDRGTASEVASGPFSPYGQRVPGVLRGISSLAGGVDGNVPLGGARGSTGIGEIGGADQDFLEDSDGGRDGHADLLYGSLATDNHILSGHQNGYYDSSFSGDGSVRKHRSGRQSGRHSGRRSDQLSERGSQSRQNVLAWRARRCISGPFFWVHTLGSLLLAVLTVYLILPLIFVGSTPERSIRNAWLLVVGVFLAASVAMAINVTVSIKLGRDTSLLLRGELRSPDLAEYIKRAGGPGRKAGAADLVRRRVWPAIRDVRRFLSVHRMVYAAIAVVASVVIFCLMYAVPSSAYVLRCWYSSGCRASTYSQLVAYRGCSSAAPDNSVMACSEAAESSHASMIMVDLQATADGRTVALASPDLRDVLEKSQMEDLYAETCEVLMARGRRAGGGAQAGTSPGGWDEALPAACVTPHDVMAQQLKVLRTYSTGRRYVRLDPHGFYHRYTSSLDSAIHGSGLEYVRAKAENETIAALSDAMLTTINHSKQLLLNLVDRSGPLPPPPVTAGGVSAEVGVSEGDSDAPEALSDWEYDAEGPGASPVPRNANKATITDNEDYRPYAAVLTKAVARDLSDLGFLDSSKQSVVSFRVSSRQMFQELVCRTSVLTVIVPIEGYLDEWWSGLNCHTTPLAAKSLIVGIVVEAHQFYLLPRVHEASSAKLQVHFDRADSAWMYILAASSGATHVYTSIPNTLDMKVSRDSVYAPLCLAMYVLSIVALLALGAVWELSVCRLRHRASVK